MAATPAKGKSAPAFNRNEAADFLGLRWQAAQSQSPTVFNGGPVAAAASTPSSTPQPKKAAPWGPKPAANKPNAGSTAPSLFAANLVKAAGHRRGAA
ncbi:unnamed protein product [Jaminaea pallidilutea]